MSRAGRTNVERRLRTELSRLKLPDGGLLLKPIATIRTPFKGRCGTPRQGTLAPHTRGLIVFEGGISFTSVEGLEGFSHLWVLFVFHQNTNLQEHRRTAPAKIAPPRLFGKKVGVFSTRSPHRPNPIGLTVVKIQGIRRDGTIEVSGVDICDGSPVIDVKPYIKYDRVEHPVMPEWVVAEDLPSWQLNISSQAESSLRGLLEKKASPFYESYEDFVLLLQDTLLHDPRSVHQGRGKVRDSDPYGCNIDNIAVQFTVTEDEVIVVGAFQQLKFEDPPVEAEAVELDAGAVGAQADYEAKSISKVPVCFSALACFLLWLCQYFFDVYLACIYSWSCVNFLAATITSNKPHLCP